MKVNVYYRGEKIINNEIEKERVIDIKRKIMVKILHPESESKKFKINLKGGLKSSDLIISFDGKILSDKLPLKIFNVENLILDLNIREDDDVEMNSYDQNVRVRNLLNNKIMSVDPSRLLVREDGVYFITRKTEKKNFFEKFRQILNNLNQDLILRMSLVFSFFLMKNFGLGIALLFISLFKYLNSFRFKFVFDCKSQIKILYLLGYYFISIFVDGIEDMITT